jgi:hypothetical protein
MLNEIFKENKWRIIVIYTVSFVEFTVFSLMPYVIGLAIDDLMAGHYRAFFGYVALSVGAMVIGVFRRMYDTRVFMRIYTIKASMVIRSLMSSRLDYRRIISRYGLVGLYSDFFEYTLPNIIHSIIGIVVGISMIAVISPILLFFIVPAVVVELCTHVFFSRLIQKREYALQHTREEISHNIAEGKDCFHQLNDQYKIYVSKSDLESKSWGFVDLLSVVVELTCILTVTRSGLSLGEITSLLLYVNKIFEKTHMSFFFFTGVKLLKMSDDLLIDSNKYVVDELNR